MQKQLKTCAKCQTEKDISDFKNGKGSAIGWCRPCFKVYRQQYWKTKGKDTYHKYKYGLSKDEYQQLLDTQQNKCKLCELTLSKTPDVDHCHATGKIRGILCRRCNLLLGLVNDERKLLQRAIDYLSV
jgi:hypothetical protein